MYKYYTVKFNLRNVFTGYYFYLTKIINSYSLCKKEFYFNGRRPLKL